MRISKITICLLLSLATNNIYAEDEIVAIEQKPAETTLANDDSTRLSLCERDIQQLTGRVEILEHAVKELQKTQPTPSNIQTNEQPTAAPVATGAIPSATAQDSELEKREYDTALAALKESKFAEAETMFNNFIQKYPSAPLISNAYFWYAESFYRRGEFDKAAVHYLKTYKQYPKSAKAGDSLLKLALSLGELKKNKEACAILSKLEEEFKQRPASSIKRSYDAKMKFGCK